MATEIPRKKTTMAGYRITDDVSAWFNPENRGQRAAIMPLKSKFHPLQLAEVPLHLAVFSQFPNYGDNIALVNAATNQTLTYKQLIDLQPRVSSGLVKLGVQKGDVVLICSPNSIEYSVMFYSILGAGGTVATMNPQYTTYEMADQLKDCKPKFIYTMPNLVNNLKDDSYRAGINPIIISYVHKEGCIPYTQLTGDNGSACPTPDSLMINPKEDVACILYSSGTTGLPKGVMLTHYNITSNLMQIRHEEMRDPALDAVDPSDPTTQQVVMNYLPLYHSYGLVCMNVFALAGGCKLVTLAKFHVKPFLEAIEKYRVTVMSLVPPVAIILAKHPLVSKYDLSSLNRVGCGAAPLSKETEVECTQKLKMQNFKQGYGMTETSPVVFGHPYWSNKPGSVGMLVCNTEVKIVDSITNHELGPNEQGELLVRGPQVMKGYLNKPEATRATIDKDGWLHTGDVAYYDEEEYFHIVDRLKELIKYQAYQVAPAELEALLLEHPAVADAAVIGIPDPTAGELPRAYVVRKNDVKLTELDIHKFVQERATHYKWLRGGVEFLDEIPKSQSGKILRRKLRDAAVKSKL